MPCNLLATSGVWGQASSRAGQCHGPVICAAAQSAVLRRASYLVQCSAVTLLTTIEQGALNFHSARASQIMQPVLVNSQEPDLQEAWVHRDTKTLRGGILPAANQATMQKPSFPPFGPLLLLIELWASLTAWPPSGEKHVGAQKVKQGLLRWWLLWETCPHSHFTCPGSQLLSLL